jgi:hypothetical protein
MKSMLKRVSPVVGAAVLAAGIAFAPSASANMLSAGGVDYASGSGSMLSATTWSSDITGGTLSGFGVVNSINGNFGYQGAGSSSQFCSLSASCELTFVFDNYTVTSQSGTQATMTGGTLNFYVDSTGDFTNTMHSGGTVSSAEASNGTLWLSLVGHQFVGPNGLTGGTLYATGSGIGTNSATANSHYQYDVVGGLAASSFNTNTVDSGNGTFADLFGGGSFSPCSPNTMGGCPLPFFGDEHINYYAVPEPSDLGMMGFGLLMVGLLGLRFRQSRYRR